MARALSPEARFGSKAVAGASVWPAGTTDSTGGDVPTRLCLLRPDGPTRENASRAYVARVFALVRGLVAELTGPETEAATTSFSEPANSAAHPRISALDGRERLVEIGNDVVHVLDAH